MSQIVPTITAENPHTYREQIERVEPFAKRIHIDLMDGLFTPNQSILVEQVWLPKGVICDIHLMFAEPEDVISDLAVLEPNLIIFPAEASFQLDRVQSALKGLNIKLGLALLPETSIESLGNAIKEIDHLLIFSGNLGYQGGSTANLDLLQKAKIAKKLNPKLEIGWDGSINEKNVREISASGIDTINTGGYIHGNLDPHAAYQTLKRLVEL